MLLQAGDGVAFPTGGAHWISDSPGSQDLGAESVVKVTGDDGLLLLKTGEVTVSASDSAPWGNDPRMAPSAGGDSPGEWFVAKTKGIDVGASASLLTGGITSAVKSWSDRTRPNGSNTDSFPSGHSSSASAYATLASRNLRSIDMGPNLRKTMEISFGVIAAGTAWARVEGNVHYPSDVLAGMALGHFVAAFINDAFMGLDDSATGSVALALTSESVSIRVWRAY